MDLGKSYAGKLQKVAEDLLEKSERALQGSDILHGSIKLKILIGKEVNKRRK